MNRAVLACVLLGLAWPVLAKAPLQPGDFAYGAPIETSGEAPIHELRLPPAVYQAVTRDDLGDLRVFNARNEIVPHALRRPRRAEAVTEWSALTLFPVRSRRDRAGGELSLRVERNKEGSIVQVHATGAPAGAPVALYVVENRDGKRAIRALEPDWKDGPGEGFAGKLAVDASDDLKHWRVVAREAPLMRLRHAGETLDRRQIALGALKARYLRLRWVEPANDAPVLSALRAEYVDDGAAPERQWLALQRATAGEKRGEFLYTLAGRMPVDRVRIRLPQTNAVAGAELYSRAERGDAWQRRAGGLIYRVNKGGSDVTQEDFAVSAGAGMREWRLVLSSKDGGLGDEPPQVEVGWLPHALVFSARGAGPYRLAYGRAGLSPGDASLEKLLTAPREGEPEFVVQAATLGAQEVLGGDKRLALSLGERNWRTWLLWGALGAGVLLLGWMAARLARQMKPQA
jgi:hypothetical protein